MKLFFKSLVTIIICLLCLPIFSFSNTKTGIINAFIQRSTKDIDYSSYFGGYDLDRIEDVIADSTGNFYIVGSTKSCDLPINKAFQESNKGGTDAFVAKFNLSMDIEWLTYIGGDSEDFGTSLCLSPDESTLYIAGYTDSYCTFLPDHTKILKDNITPKKGWCGFFVAFNSDGDIQDSILLGGSFDDGFFDIKCNKEDVFIVGSTHSSTIFPNVQSTLPNSNLSLDGIIISLNRSTFSLNWYSFLGGRYDDRILSIALDNSNLYVTGTTSSDDFPIINAPQHEKKANDFSIFYSCWDLEGNIEISTYMNAGMWSEGLDIQVDDDFNAYICGFTHNFDGSFVFTNWYTGKTDSKLSPCDSYVMKIDINGNIIWTTGFSYSRLTSLQCLSNGKIVAAGWATGYFPITEETSFQKENHGSVDSVIIALSPHGELLFSSWWGGSGKSDKALSITINHNSQQFGIVGQTDSQDFPITKNAFMDNNTSELSGTIVLVSIDFLDRLTLEKNKPPKN
jgi:hypothetical protein